MERIKLRFANNFEIEQDTALALLINEQLWRMT